MSGIPAHAEKKTLDERLERATSAARSKLAELHAGLYAAAHIKNTGDAIVKRPVPELFPKLRASVDAVAKALASTNVDRLTGLLNSVEDANCGDVLSVEKLLQLAPAFDGIDAGLGQLHNSLVGTEGSVLMAVAAESASLGQRVEAAKKERSELADRKQRLAAGAGNYNRDTVLALERIRERLPDAGVQVLCDLVEPVSEEWQGAIEGYMDGARFNLIVRPDWEARTIDFLQSWGSRSKVVQGKRCLDRADKSRVPGTSIIHELRTDHPIAQAYLIEQFGSVVKVADSEELRRTSRGLTKDGKGSGAMTMFICERRDFVLGRKARERALQTTTEMLEAVDKDIFKKDRMREVWEAQRQEVREQAKLLFDAAEPEEVTGVAT